MRALTAHMINGLSTNSLRTIKGCARAGDDTFYLLQRDWARSGRDARMHSGGRAAGERQGFLAVPSRELAAAARRSVAVTQSVADEMCVSPPPSKNTIRLRFDRATISARPAG